MPRSVPKISNFLVGEGVQPNAKKLVSAKCTFGEIELSRKNQTVLFHNATDADGFGEL